MGHQVSPTWHDEKIKIVLELIRIINNSSCSWAQCYTIVIVILFLQRAAELNPFTRPHRCLFNLQVTHVGYGESRKEKRVFIAYSMQCSHPNYPLPCASLKSFTSLDNSNTLVIWATKTSDGRHTLRSAKISDGWRNMQIPICTSKQIFASVSAATSAMPTIMFESVGNRNQFDGIQDSHVQRFCATARLHAERFLNINKTRTPILQVGKLKFFSSLHVQKKVYNF